MAKGRRPPRPEYREELHPRGSGGRFTRKSVPDDSPEVSPRAAKAMMAMAGAGAVVAGLELVTAAFRFGTTGVVLVTVLLTVPLAYLLARPKTRRRISRAVRRRRGRSMSPAAIEARDKAAARRSSDAAARRSQAYAWWRGSARQGASTALSVLRVRGKFGSTTTRYRASAEERRMANEL
jgi:hypothetical protein